MDGGVRACVDAKRDVFRQYFDVPEEVQVELDAFGQRVYAMGEQASDAMDFEAKFAAQFQEEYNAFFLKCTPRAVPMTAEQLAESKRLENEMMYGTNDPAKIKRKKLAQAAKDVAEMATTELEQEAIAMRRRAMIEAGTFDDYTRATNKIEDAKIIGKAIGGLFRKK